MKRKILALLLSATMLFTLGGCSSDGKGNNKGGASNNTLVIGTLTFNGVFNPFFYNTAYDNQAYQTVYVRRNYSRGWKCSNSLYY